MSGGIGGFRGVSASQDARFVNKQKIMLKKKKFPKELDVVVDYSRVNWAVMREWTAKRITELLGIEDEVLIQFIHNRLEELNDLNPKELYLELMPFLEKNTGLFMKELWTLLASAAEHETGIPQQILDAKAEEVQKQLAQHSSILESVEEQRKRVNQEIEALCSQTKEEVKKEPTQKKEKPKRWAPPPRTESTVPVVPLQYIRRQGTGFSGGVGHRRRQKDRWREGSISPVQKRRKSPKRRPASRSQSPRRRHHPRERSSRRDRRRSRSPKAHRHPFEAKPPKEMEAGPKGEAGPGHSLSRSPPQSRHSSPPPRSYNLARKRQHHDRKPRSIAEHVSSGSPATKSPSPRSRNRMSSTPDLRERTPSPPSPPLDRVELSTPSPIPKPTTPRTRTPPVRHNSNQEPERKRESRGVRQFGSMYAFPDEGDALCDRPRYGSRRSPPPEPRHHHRSDLHRSRPRIEGREGYRRGYERAPYRYPAPAEDRRSGRHGYSYRSYPSPERHRFSERRERRRSLSRGSRGSPYGDSRDLHHEGRHRRSDRGDLGSERVSSHRYEHTSRGKVEQQLSKAEARGSPEKQPSQDSPMRRATSEESDDHLKRKEKLKRKLSEILEKKNSLNLDKGHS